MTTHDCCGGRPRHASRLLEAAGWVVPSTLLALLPKCPLCLAAYVTLGTGIGLSATAAGYLRVLLVVGCVGVIALLAARRTCRLLGRLFPREP